MILISVITVCRNEKNRIEETLKSVSRQKFIEFEHIVVDGFSDDGTLELIQKYPKVKIFSSPPQGIFNAMNFGAKHAAGQYLVFLNAGDTFQSNLFSLFADACHEEKFDYTLGPITLVFKNKMKRVSNIPQFKINQYKLGKMLDMPAAHMSCFVSKKVFNRLGGFDESFQSAADYDFLLRLISENKNFYLFNDSVGNFLMGGQSFSIKGFFETFLIKRKHKMNYFISSLGLVISISKYIIRKLFSQI